MVKKYLFSFVTLASLVSVAHGNPYFQECDKSSANPAKIHAKPLGSKGNPVRADLPRGQHDYLRRLQCASGDAPAFKREGNVGFGPWGCIVDVYVLACPDGSTTRVYMDLYHPGFVEVRTIEGFGIKVGNQLVAR